MTMARYGVHAALEAEANRLLKESMAGITSMSAKSDILTPWKERDRRDREVYVESGTPDPSTRRGIYHRAWNPDAPHLNSRDAVAAGGLGRFHESAMKTGRLRADSQQRNGEVITMLVGLRVGSTVVLSLAWGSQQRNQCLRCQRFTGTGERVECRGCGAVYVHAEGPQYVVEALP